MLLSEMIIRLYLLMSCSMAAAGAGAPYMTRATLASKGSLCWNLFHHWGMIVAPSSAHGEPVFSHRRSESLLRARCASDVSGGSLRTTFVRSPRLANLSVSAFSSLVPASANSGMRRWMMRTSAQYRRCLQNSLHLVFGSFESDVSPGRRWQRPLFLRVPKPE